MSESPLLDDATFYEWLFFSRGLHDSKQQQNFKVVGDILTAISIDLKSKRQEAQNLPSIQGEAVTGEFTRRLTFDELSPLWPLNSQSIALIPYFKPDEEKQIFYEVEARTLTDTYYIQIEQNRPDQRTIAELAACSNWKSSSLDNQEFGRAVCYAAVVDDESTNEQISAWLAQIAFQARGAQPPEPTSIKRFEREVLEMPGFSIHFNSFNSQEMAVLLCRKTSQPHLGRFIHSVLPELMQNRLKAQALQEQSHKSLSEIQSLSKELKQILDGSPLHSSLPLQSLEESNCTVSQYRLRLCREMENLEKLAETLRIGVRNIAGALSEMEYIAQKVGHWVWEARREKIENTVSEPLTSLMGQIEVELRYAAMTQRAADSFLQSLNTTVGVRTAGEERQLQRVEQRMTWLLAFFAVMSLPQVFGDSPWKPDFSAALDYYWRLGLAGAAFIGLVILDFLFRRADK